MYRSPQWTTSFVAGLREDLVRHAAVYFRSFASGWGSDPSDPLASRLRGKVPVPAGFGRVEVVHWMVQEVQTLIDKHQLKSITIRASEAMQASTALLERVELEAAVYAAAGSRGLKAVFKKRRVTIAKDLCHTIRLSQIDGAPLMINTS